MTALLDVNMLIALLDRAHVHHTRAKAWMLDQPTPRWASCPLTQNGFIRIISQPAYPGGITVGQATELLTRAANTPYHEFWQDDLSVLDGRVFDHTKILGPKQITDAYLLGLAVARQGRLVGLDQTIPLSSVVGATPANLVIV